MFQCRRCGKQWNVEGYRKEGTVFTLCDKCAEEIINERSF